MSWFKLRTDHACNLLDQKVPHLMIEGAKAIELEDQCLVALSRAVAVVGKIKMSLRKTQLCRDVLDIALTEVWRSKELLGRFKVGRAQQEAEPVGGCMQTRCEVA